MNKCTGIKIVIILQSHQFAKKDIKLCPDYQLTWRADKCTKVLKFDVTIKRTSVKKQKA